MADVTICKSSNLEDSGAGWRFKVRHGRKTRTAFVVRFEGEVRCYINQCAHTPMELDMDDGRFFDASGKQIICATHGAIYNPADGACLGGPCGGGGLISLAVSENDGYIYLDEQNISLVKE